jgi:addiction module HigA family antidote
MPIHNPLHPGQIIQDILIVGAGLTVTEASKQLGVNRTTLSRLLNGRAGISAEMALRLSKLLPNTDIMLWMNIQRDYDISMTVRYASKIHIKPLKAA